MNAAQSEAGASYESVVVRDFVLSIMATGAVKPEVGAEVDVGARVSGKVVVLNVDIGDPVKKGDVLAVLEHDDLEAQVRRYEAELASARVQLQAARSQAAADLDRARALVAQRDADTTTERERLDVLRAQRQADLELQQRKLEGMRRELAQELNIAGTRVKEQKAQHTLAGNVVRRMRALYDKGMLAEQTLDNAQADVDGALARLGTAKASHAMAAIRLEEEVALQQNVVATAEVQLATTVRLQEQVVHQAEVALGLARTDQAAVEAKNAATISNLEAAIPQVEAALAEARVRLSYATILSPIDGVVGAVTTQVGETVAAGFNAPIFVTLIDLNRLQVDAFVDEVDIGKVHPGQKAVFTVDAFPAEEFAGVVSAIYPRAVIQDNVVYYDVVIQIETQHGGRLRPEMTTNVSISLDARHDVLAIPSAAVARQEGRSLVQIREGGTKDGPLLTREVKLGWRDGRWVEVVDGLREGDTVLLPLPQDQKAKE